eukprot:CAMPEP_0171615908 /NCGR_PEP_ID=MMETSP0990-20121206/13154_1 /TAXON_ID=483369 /ORGANISM="non described non described, Strain CCMP2098" /LENGTH=76 /DNA_ID=CAMNT_0012180057 /DNA_START=15 /DNA_END=242 /DNA_ORIENTATION=+
MTGGSTCEVGHSLPPPALALAFALKWDRSEAATPGVTSITGEFVERREVAAAKEVVSTASTEGAASDHGTSDKSGW